MCALGMYVCFNVHVYDEYFYVSMHMCLVSVYIQLMCVHSVCIFMPNIYVCVYALYVVCMYSMSVCMHVDACVWVVWHMNA